MSFMQQKVTSTFLKRTISLDGNERSSNGFSETGTLAGKGKGHLFCVHNKMPKIRTMKYYISLFFDSWFVSIIEYFYMYRGFLLYY